MQADALLTHHDGADIDIGGVFDEVIDGIAAENFDSLALHDFRDGCAELHGDSSQDWPMLGSAFTG